MGSHTASKQANEVFQDITDKLRNGPVKVIPAPPGYIPPPDSKRRPSKHRPHPNYKEVY